MPGTRTYVSTKSGTALLYITEGLAVFQTGPRSTITGEKIEGPFLNTSFRGSIGVRPAKLKAEPKFADELVSITGETATKAKVEAAFAILREKYHPKAKPAPKKAAPRKATAKTSVKKAPKETMTPMPTMAELNLARFEAMERLMEELRHQITAVA